MPVTPYNVNDVTYLTKINKENFFWWQPQYLMILEYYFSWQVQYLEKYM